MRIGLISDTHGLLRPGVHDALAGVELILHAGDVGGDEILDELALIAPVEAVFGNTDYPDNPRLSGTVSLAAGGLQIRVCHGHHVRRLTPDVLIERYPAADVIVYGHTHVPKIVRADGRLIVNPGAAGPARYDEIAPSVGILTILDGTAEATIVDVV